MILGVVTYESEFRGGENKIDPYVECSNPPELSGEN